MDTSKLIVNVNAFIKCFSSNASTLESLLMQLEKSIKIVHEQQVVFSTINEARLPLDFVEKHPDVKKKVINCVSSLIDEEITEIRRLLQLLEAITNNLNKLFEKIEQNMSELNWEEISQFFASALTEVVDWSEKCTKYFRLIFCNITSELNVFHSDIPPSKRLFKNIFDVSSDSKNLIFNHPAIPMFTLFEKEILKT